MDPYLKSFRAIQSQIPKTLPHGLICKVGAYRGSVVLKLQKPAWTNDPMHLVPNTTGIFFSIWLTDESLAQSRILYNIHALKLRLLKSTSIAHAGNFARQFRKLLSQKTWPNLRTNFGPCTLMQGWSPFIPETFETDTRKLMNRFIPLAPQIDTLLKEHAKSKI